jgi:hypothetical protein
MQAVPAYYGATYYGNYGDEYYHRRTVQMRRVMYFSQVLTTSVTPGAYSTFLTAGLFAPAYSNGSQTPFLAKFDSSGARRWGTYYSEALQSFSGDLAADDSGRVLYTIYSNNLNYDYPVTKKCNNFWSPQSLSISLFDTAGGLESGESCIATIILTSVRCASRAISVIMARPS